MRKTITSLFAVALLFLGIFMLSACNTASPQRTFEIAALNTNMLSDFGSREIKRLLETEPQTLDVVNKKMIPSSYQNYFKFQISDLQTRYNSINNIKEDKDNKELLAASKDLFSYVIIKETEGYLPIAKMKDNNAPMKDIQKAINDFDIATQQEMDLKFKTLTEAAKVYAGKFNINVKFDF
jgi:hypothetical protein